MLFVVSCAFGLPLEETPDVMAARATFNAAFEQVRQDPQ